tara:strand:- start:242 stop:409 length:168 start_codon:yes stop_codon:yes gene_type:complete
MWIDEIIKTLGADLFRYKGVLNVAGMQQKFVFQGVGMPPLCSNRASRRCCRPLQG